MHRVFTQPGPQADFKLINLIAKTPYEAGFPPPPSPTNENGAQKIGCA